MFGVEGFVSCDDERWLRICGKRIAAFAGAAGEMNANETFGRVVLGQKMAGGDFDFLEGVRERDF